MKRTISSIAAVLVVVFGGIIASGVVAQQYYYQPIGSSPVVGSYSNVGTPTYQSTPVISYSSNVVSYPSYPSGQAQSVQYQSHPQTYGQPVYSTPVNTTPSSYSTTSNYSSAPAYSSQVTYASPQNYSSAPVTYSNAPATYSSNVQSYPTGTYASQTYPTQSSNQVYSTQNYQNYQPQQQTYTSATYPVNSSYVQPATYPSNRNVIRSQPVNYSNSSYSTSNYSSGSQYTSTSGSDNAGLAQQKAVRAAQMGLRGHLGGGLGGAKYEGVGWSNQSAQRAIESCCYWGARPTAQIGCTRGSDGFWYACVLYN